MISRHCPGCGLEFSVPESPARGSTRKWCSEGCNRRTQRDRKTLEIEALLAEITARAVLPPGDKEMRVAVRKLVGVLQPEIERARERERVKLERTKPAKRARKPRKGAPSNT